MARSSVFAGCAAAGPRNALDRRELKPRVAKPRQQPVEGRLVQGDKRQLRVAARQQTKLLTIKDMSSSLAEVAGDPDLVALHGPDVRRCRARARLAKGRSSDNGLPGRKEGIDQATPSRAAGSDEAELLGAHQGLRAARRAELRDHVADMPLRGAQ